MKKEFFAGRFKATYNEVNEMWYIYMNNNKIAKVYDDSCSIAFTDEDTSLDFSELREIMELTKTISQQYEKLNN